MIAAGRSGRRNGKRLDSERITGVHSAHPYHCGASPTNARQTAMGRPPMRANITVSTVESTAGIVHTARIFHAEMRSSASMGAAGVVSGSIHDENDRRTERSQGMLAPTRAVGDVSAAARNFGL